MSSRAVDLNLFPDPVHAEDASDGTGSLGSLSAKSRVPGPDDHACVQHRGGPNTEEPPSPPANAGRKKPPHKDSRSDSTSIPGEGTP